MSTLPATLRGPHQEAEKAARPRLPEARVTRDEQTPQIIQSRCRPSRLPLVLAILIALLAALAWWLLA
jgi:hypothetical protein